MEVQKVLDMVNVNCHPQAVLSHIFATRFLKRESKSAIVNLSSVAAYVPLGWGALYASTKAFNM
eukprot:CAMPEP_0116913320 /NCGR_PEP_ID=MMETSP0467-20121206/16628_1 /TAXON_ID=283647 /ORGANISM="Mesodinium pulex, Strain SPMC105" /LENGTH=63 /DNA_ID=CAMNT_0004589501 /DNA_START=421 /DNA_END=612 /DNA_ORIENTATION=-